MAAVLSPLAIGPFSDEMLAGAVITVAAGAFGLVTLYRGVTSLRRGYRIASHDQVDAGSVHLEDGVVEVQGEAEPVDGTIESAYTGTECLAYTYEKKRKERDHSGDDSNTRWRTVDSGEGKTPFYVRDGSGRVAVDPADAAVSLDTDRVSSGVRIRKYEGRLEPGETVHVYGEKIEPVSADEAPGGERLYIGDGGEDTSFTVSDTTETRTVLRYVATGVGTVIVSVLILALATVPTLVYTDRLSPIVEFASQYLPLALA